MSVDKSTEKEYLDIITASNLTYKQKLLHLAQAAENNCNPIKTTKEFDKFFAARGLDDMTEGKAPYRPRYICPNYGLFAEQGSEFLRLDKPETLDDLLWGLAMLYDNVPSVTSRPVYCGQLDKIIDPFITDMDDDEVLPRLHRFLNYIDRTVASGYCHANIGPEDTRAGRLLLQAMIDTQNACPNLTMKYDPNITPDDFMILCIEAAMKCANPAFANHPMHVNTYPGDYTVVSCYNVLPLGGGAYSLDRLLLPGLARMSSSVDDFMNNILPSATAELCNYMNDRIRFEVEQSHFFDSSFLVKEGLLSRDRFTAMFGVAGMSECIKELLHFGDDRAYGTDPEGNELAQQICQKIYDQVNEFDAVYSEVAGGRFTLHAQAGFADQVGITPGVRIKVGDEPEVFYDHIRQCASMHKYFNAGVSDIFPVEPTAEKNPEAILDVIKGAFAIDDKYLSFYSSDSDLVRITGFLVKRSEMEKYARGEAVLADTSHDGEGNWRANDLADRKVRL
ncbi:YjjI family glycine radical enzyme [Olsenella sp. Marseille-QA0557]|uniref:YjjI family glycine radical enzyme n=1 Tax=Olsenella sp. Marseille-QA0557 TaxID=3378782 RepID=UPI003D0C0355